MQKEKQLIPKLRFAEFEDKWVKLKLSDVAQIITGSTPSTFISDFYNGGKLFVSPVDIQLNRYVITTKTTLTDLGFSKGRKVKKGSVLFVSIGSTIGKVGQVKEDVVTNQQINSLISKPEFSDDFIYSLLEKNGKKVKHLSGVQAVPLINKTDFSDLKFNYPQIKEQQKIANFLTAIDTQIQTLSTKKTLLEQYKKGVMQKIFKQEIRFKDDDGNDFAEWEFKRIGNIFKERNEKNFTDMELLSVSINKGIYPQSESNKTDNSNSDKSKYKRVLKNDIAYNSMRMWQGASDVSKFDGIVSPAYTILKGNENQHSRFYGYLFKMSFMIQTFQKHSQGLTSDTWNLKYPMISKIKINVPSLKEQIKIANFLSAIDKEIALVATKIEHTKAYKKGLLQQMFV